MAIYNNDIDPNEQMWNRQNEKTAETEDQQRITWDRIFKKWIDQSTKFNLSSLVEWLKDNYNSPESIDSTNPIPKVNRLEVINHTSEKLGRELVKYGVNVELSFQDDGKTLKVFLTDKAS